MDKFEKQYNRNVKGQEYERKGNISKAIRLYEKNVDEGFDGNFPYERLAIIYKKHKDLDNEIRIVKKAITVFEKVVKEGRSDGETKLDKFKVMLEKILSR